MTIIKSFHLLKPSLKTKAIQRQGEGMKEKEATKPRNQAHLLLHRKFKARGRNLKVKHLLKKKICALSA